MATPSYIIKKISYCLLACVISTKATAFKPTNDFIRFSTGTELRAIDSGIVPDHRLSKRYTAGQHLNTAGWLTFSAGACSFLIGGLIKEKPYSDYRALGALFGGGSSQQDGSQPKLDNSTSKTLKKIGTIVMIASVPMIILGAVTKHKAKMSIRSQSLNPGIPGTHAGSITGISFIIPTR